MLGGGCNAIRGGRASGVGREVRSVPRRMLLIGMCTRRTKKPMKPMMAKPISVAWEILMYSLRSGLLQRLTRRTESIMKACRGSLTLRAASIVVRGWWLVVARGAGCGRWRGIGGRRGAVGVDGTRTGTRPELLLFSKWVCEAAFARAVRRVNQLHRCECRYCEAKRRGRVARV